MGPPEPPAEVAALARRRALARAARDFALADALRAQLGELGWLVADAGDGYSLSPAPRYPVLPGLAHLPTADPPPAPGQPAPGQPAPGQPGPGGLRATVALLVQGWPADLRECVTAVLAHAPDGVVISGLDLGNIDGAGDELHELALAHPGKITEWHVPAGPGWGAARTGLLHADPAPIHVIMETSTILTGDAISPLLAAATAPGVVAAGWQGADPAADAREFVPAGPGPVTALLGYLLAVRTRAALAAGGFPARARFYRNADLEFSLLLGRSGALVVPPGPLPVRQARHRGYHDTDPAYRDAESRRNYGRVLALLRAARRPGRG